MNKLLDQFPTFDPLSLVHRSVKSCQEQKQSLLTVKRRLKKRSNSSSFLPQISSEDFEWFAKSGRRTLKQLRRIEK